jgi:hypothetical protein
MRNPFSVTLLEKELMKPEKLSSKKEKVEIFSTSLNLERRKLPK